MSDFTPTISTHSQNGPLSAQYLLSCYCCKTETISSYLCSNSRMDSITPEVDAFCCTVARNVNSLLFRKSWINFSLTWGAAWISLSISKNCILKKRRKERNNTPVKMLSQKDSDYIFHFPINIFHFWESSTMLHHCICSMKKPKCHLCQHAHLSLWQVHNWSATDFLTEFLTGCWAVCVCCEQIKLL